MSDLLNQTELAKALGVGKSTIHQWTKDRAITPDISEGKVIRYDLAKVRKQLLRRATEKAERDRD